MTDTVPYIPDYKTLIEAAQYAETVTLRLKSGYVSLECKPLGVMIRFRDIRNTGPSALAYMVSWESISCCPFNLLIKEIDRLTTSSFKEDFDE